MSQELLISVVMPVYNGELYLNEAIQSILNQTYRNYEFIIIDDGSTDNSLDIINKYKDLDDRIVLISRENKGLIASLNEGVSKAKGKYIARMDADDISLEKRFEDQIELMRKNRLDICGCHYFVIDEKNKFLSTRIMGINEEGIILNLAYSVPFAHGSVMIKKEVLKKYKYGNSEFQAVEDYALWIDMYSNHIKFGNVDEFLFKYRAFKESFSNTKSAQMESERLILSKQFIKQNRAKLKNIIDINLSKNLSEEEKILFIDTSLLLKYKLGDCAKKVSKKVLLVAILKYLFK